MAGLAASLLLSAVIWLVFDWPMLFLAVPFVPFLFWRSVRGSSAKPRHCPECGFRASDPAVRYCPRDGRRLQDL